jgi:parallel beta-helix repeat protein
MLAGIALLFPFQGFSRADDDDHNAIPINSCDAATPPISRAGRYFLANDLTQCDLGISITASHVKLELRGHTIQGVSTPNGMITAKSADAGATELFNIEIAGPGTVTGGFTGIDFENVHDSSVHDLVVVGNAFGGIVVNASDPMKDATASTGNEFRDNVVAGNFSDGISVNGGNDNLFIHNNVVANLFNGISVNGGNKNHFFHNNLSGNGSDGLLLFNANDNVARQNTADANGQNGIEIGTLGSGNTIHDNTALGNVVSDLVDLTNCTQGNTWNKNSFNPDPNFPSCVQ